MNYETIAKILKDRKALIEVANLCDKAYADGCGHPEWHEPFGEDKPELVAQNMAGLQSVNSSIGIIAELRCGCLPADRTVECILGNIAKDELNSVEKNVILRLANCALGAGQAFRTDKGQLGRLTGMNIFDLLCSEDVLKDYHQIKAVATWLLKKNRG